MKITLLVEKEEKEEKLSDIAKHIIIPFARTILPHELKNMAGIYATTPQDFGRTSHCFMTTDQSRGLDPTFLGEPGAFEYMPDSGMWKWKSSEQ